MTKATGTARTIFSHHPECRIGTSNLCTCRELIGAEIRLDRIRHGWAKPAPKPLTGIDVAAGLIGIGYIIGRYIA